jgi:hypothetical protein
VPERFLLGPWRPATVAVYAAALVVLCVVLTVLGFRLTNHTNFRTDDFDQGAYILMARQMKDASYPWYTDGTRNPLFPWLAARVLDPQAPEFFAAGKKLNVLLGVIGTALAGAFFARRMGPLAAFNATLLAALAVLLPISTFFGAEAIFYALFLFVCVLAMRLLNDNPVWLYALLGLVAGLAWLAKPSATPFLGLFAVFTVLRLILSRFPNLPWPLAAPNWSWRRLAIGAVLCGAIYGGLIFPRLHFAQQEYGKATYSLPGFWFWADDWETCTRLYTDCRKETLAKLPPHLQPSAAGYFKRHSVGEALERLKKGSLVRLGQFFNPEVNKEGKRYVEKSGKPRRAVLMYRGLYLGFLAALAAAMAGLALVRGKLSEIGPFALPLLLGLATFAVYVLAMGWYVPTGPGHRFIMTLYLPALWILAQGADQLRRAADWRPAGWIFLGGQAVIFLCLTWRVISLLTGGPFDKVSYAF